MLSTDNDFTTMIDRLVEAHHLAVALNQSFIAYIIKMALLEAVQQSRH